MAFDVNPSVSARDRLLVERALEALSEEGAGDDVRASSSWWRAGTCEAVGSTDGDEGTPEAYVFSPRKTRGATLA